MHAICLPLLLYLCTLSISFYYAVVNVEAIASAELLLDSFHTLRGYEILSIREEHDEDVARIRKRAD